MEKIKFVLGMPYTLEIGTNDASMKKCEGEMCINMMGYKISIPLKHVKDLEYTLTIPKKLKELSGKNLRYSLFVYAEAARFMVEKGELEVLSEESFKVSQVTAADKAQEDKVKTKDKAKEISKKETQPKTEDKFKVEDKTKTKTTKVKKEITKKEKIKESVAHIIKETKKEEVAKIKRKSEIELEKLKETQRRRKLVKEAKQKQQENKEKVNQNIMEAIKQVK